MNNLSWLIYLAQVIGNVDTVIDVVMFISIMGTILSFVCFGAAHVDDDFAPARPSLWTWARRCLIVACITTPFSIFVPTNKTVLLIAASEIGQRVVSSDKVVGVVDPSLDLLKTYIASETKKLKKELTKEDKHD